MPAFVVVRSWQGEISPEASLIELETRTQHAPIFSNKEIATELRWPLQQYTDHATLALNA